MHRALIREAWALLNEIKMRIVAENKREDALEAELAERGMLLTKPTRALLFMRDAPKNIALLIQRCQASALAIAKLYGIFPGKSTVSEARLTQLREILKTKIALHEFQPPEAPPPPRAFLFDEGE